MSNPFDAVEFATHCPVVSPAVTSYTIMDAEYDNYDTITFPAVQLPAAVANVAASNYLEGWERFSLRANY